ncbi:MAG: MoaD/ThiS family protein [Verrucomicrobiaceae bacterium]|nr:MoaD/ThiS family protein [Verrucomicrobiaceae bacterium]
MTIQIHYRGQLAAAMGVDAEKIEIDHHSSMSAILQDLAKKAGPEFSNIVLDDEGVPRRTLLIAVDGEQVADYDSCLAPGANEITLIPPISGG